MSLIGLAALALFYRDPAVAAALKLDASSIAQAALLGSMMFVASCYALLGKPHGHYVLLTAAVLYYGALIFQNVALLGHGDSLFSQDGEMRLWSNIVRQSLALLFVAWATLSVKTRVYFSGHLGAP